MVKIGVLAIQGAFALHRSHIEAAGAKYVEVVTQFDLNSVDALILPGGESGTMLKLIEELQIKPALAEFLKLKPAWGICAGAILLASRVRNPEQYSFAAVDCTLERNSYGRQVDSFQARLNDYPVSFIRAPRIVDVGKTVQIINTMGTEPVALLSGNKLVTTFHPELSPEAPSPWHSNFVYITHQAQAEHGKQAALARDP